MSQFCRIRDCRHRERKLHITHSTFIRTAAINVYNALATSKGLDSWFTSGSKVYAIPGGEIHFHWVDWGPDHVTTEDRGIVLEVIPAKRFVFQWHPDQPDYATTVEINFEPIEGGTIVRLREYGYAVTKSALAAMLNCATGWGEALTLLKFYLELGAHY
jgi:uncharacterized protein YndB with AHSA1/START domain